MRILLLGEFSGVHKNLKEGLNELGYEVCLAANGDGWKNIESDLSLGDSGENLKDKLSRIVVPLTNVYKLLDYDIVQFINPSCFSRVINKPIMKFILNNYKKHKKKAFLVAAGCDHYYYLANKNYKYAPCETCQKYDLKSTCSFNNKNFANYNSFFAQNVNGIIPSLYEYAEGYRQFKNIKDTIPNPFNLKKIKYTKNNVKSKLVIFHGINREGTKGTAIIKDALDIVSQKYPQDVEIIADGKMPLEKYLHILQKTNIIVDQCFSLSYGMNAIYAMAMGKVVLSGAEEECKSELRVDKCPIVNITPDVSDIVRKLEFFIENKKLVEKVGYESRLYVEDTHDYIKIAKRYLRTWQE